MCETAKSGIWVLKGNARARMLPANLDHLRVEWRTHGSYKTALFTPGHDCLCPYQYGHGAAVRPQTVTPSGMGLLVCGAGSHPCCHLGVQAGSCNPWHSDDESLFGPPNQPKLIASMSLGHSVVFQVRRVPGDVPSSITLDHGDLLVMDGSAQSEYAHRTVSGLQGPLVNLTYRWVSQHAASCPLAGAVGCVLPSCVQGLVEPNSRWLGIGENKWTSYWGLVLLLLNLVTALMVSTWIYIRRGHRYCGQRPSCLAVHFPSRGRARWVGGRRWRLSRRRQNSKSVSFYFSFVHFWGRKAPFVRVFFFFKKKKIFLCTAE